MRDYCIILIVNFMQMPIHLNKPWYIFVNLNDSHWNRDATFYHLQFCYRFGIFTMVQMVKYKDIVWTQTLIYIWK